MADDNAPLPTPETTTIDYEHEDPFAIENDSKSGVRYRTLTWWQGGMIMIAETISLGILSLPSVVATIGIAGTVSLLLSLGLLATYTGYVIGQFKFRYEFVHTWAEAGHVLLEPLGPGWARFGKEFFGACQAIFLIFTMASHILTWDIMLNTLTDHATCTIVWGVAGLVVFSACDVPRTMRNLSWWSIGSCVSIVLAVFITMIDVAVEKPGEGKAITVKSSFPAAFLSVCNIIFAYSGHVSFFTFISEFRTPKKSWTKALLLLQLSDTTLYLVASFVIYRYTGVNVKSPALGSASPIVKKIAWGVATPTIVIAGVVYGHCGAKYLFVRIFRGKAELTSRGWKATSVWIGIVVAIWTLAWIIAQSIPVFNDLLGLITALFASWFTYGLAGWLWLFLNYGRYGESKRKMLSTGLNVAIFLLGLVASSIGLYATGKSIHENKSGSGKPWSCVSNGQ
ncbi:MAG: hypothetical protein M1831_004327 [Alyxoria varia]|nr:MAG: hypothetical protein M1831_004327 [Alyxoria varia]